MDATDIVDAVATDAQTELSRLGSSKALYAATAGEMDTREVLSATADAERAARDTYEQWAETDDHPDVRAAFGAIAAEEDDHYRTVLELLDGDHEPPADPPALHRHLRELDGSLERVGGFVGRTLASEKTKDQVIGFFVGEADPQTASTFREFRDDLDGQLDRALDLLDTLCEDEGDWDRARHHATEAIQIAYGEYVDALESMGVNPKPVC